MQALDVLIEDDRWRSHDLETLAEKAVRTALMHRELPPASCELSILACDDQRIADLNGDFRDKPRPTNVLSWPAEERAAATPGAHPSPPETDPEGLIELGDIALSYDTCAREAQAAGLPFAAHVTHLIVHGLLHLLGYDHVQDADADLMEQLEVEILGNLGYDDPYSSDMAGSAQPTRRQD